MENKKIPHWVKRTTQGTFMCLFCGGLVLQLIQGWICNNIECKKHDDSPIEHTQEQAARVTPTTAISTATGTAGDTGVGTTTTT